MAGGRAAPPARPPKLTVAVTGPTGDIGRSLLRSLERSDQVGSIVAGPDALAMIRMLPYVQGRELLKRTGLSSVVAQALERMPGVKPVLPDPGVRFQLVHHDDVASAMRAAVLGRGEPGVYNLAGPGQLTMSNLADALDWYSVPIPEVAVDATAEVLARLPFMPAEA